MMKLVLVAGTLTLAIGCADNEIEPRATTTDYSSTTYGAAATPQDSSADPNLTAERNEPAVVAGSQGAQLGLSDTNSLSQSNTNESEDASVGGPAPSERASASTSTQEQIGKFKQANATNLEQYIDFKVVGSKQQEFGTVESLWENDKQQPAYLAIKSPQAQDKVYVVPAQVAEVNTQRKMIRVPYSIETLQRAPTFSKDADLTPQDESKILVFFEAQKMERDTASAQGSSASSQQGSQQSQQQASADSNTEVQDEATIRLKEERLNVEKRLVNNGGILLRKVVRTETVNQPVQLQREEIVIERVPGDGKALENASFEGREVFIPLQREEAVINKDVVLKEVVNVGKKTEEQQRDVSAQVREEELRILNQQGQRLNQGAAAQSVSGSAQETNGAAKNDSRPE